MKEGGLLDFWAVGSLACSAIFSRKAFCLASKDVTPSGVMSARAGVRHLAAEVANVRRVVDGKLRELRRIDLVSIVVVVAQWVKLLRCDVVVFPCFLELGHSSAVTGVLNFYCKDREGIDDFAMKVVKE